MNLLMKVIMIIILLIKQILPSFHNNKFYQNLNEKISLNSERKIIFNQTITNFERNQEFTIINSHVKVSIEII